MPGRNSIEIEMETYRGLLEDLDYEHQYSTKLDTFPGRVTLYSRAADAIRRLIEIPRRSDSDRA